MTKPEIEKDVDAYIATAHHGSACVKEHNEKDGNGPKPLNIRSELSVLGCST